MLKEDNHTATTGVNAASALVTTAGVAISTAKPRTPPTTAATAFIDEDLTIPQTLIKMKEEKAKEKGDAIKDVEDSPRPIKSITTLQPLLTIDPKDKGKGVLVEEEPEKPAKKSIAELDKAQKERQKQEEATSAALAEEFDEIQARIDADHELPVRLTHKEPDYRSSKNYKIFSEMLDDFDRQDVIDLHRINKARLNFKEVLQHYKSGTQSRRKDLRKRLGHKHIRSISGSPEPRRDRTELPRKKGPKRKTVFKRLEKGGVFHGLREKEKRAESTSKKNNSKRESSRRTKALSEGEDSAEGHWKSRSKRQKSSVKEDDLSQPWAYEEIDPFTPRIRYFDFPKTRMPSHIKTYDGSEDPEDHLKIFQAIAKTEHWAMPTWCHMFISTITRNARVWFDDLPKESIDSYDDLKKAFLENYLQQKKCIKDLVEIHNINQRDGESMEEFVRRRGGPPIANGRSHSRRRNSKKLDRGKTSKREASRTNKGRSAKAAKKRETSEKDKPLTILMVQPWQKIAKQRFTQTFSPKAVISFPPLGEEDGTEGSMIIEARMGGHFVHRMYVDGGSSSKILYEHCFNRFRPEVRSQMVPAATPLVEFSGEIIWPLGQISLLLKNGDEEHSTLTWMNFMVVRSPSPYNGIIGRPGVRRIWAVPSTDHGMLKFPVTGGTAAEEKIQVAIYPVYPKQTIAIGSTLTEEGWKELYGLLRRNLDIFAWRPANMTGVPRHIAEHRLNIREGCLPVRQKKIGQAPERNKAIYEEVEKLVDAGIMKEVHYHSWLSNPVMVKRHDESWRMCVDLKDLNKACPKDGYPLPEIDWNVESLCGYPFKCFLDAYKGYHQIKMAKEDEEKTTFITSQGIFCYSKMPFRLKNVGATYQRLVDKAF
ncbi:reverse transcriptase domain-containing protein [Tanacetum coccineum]